MVTSGIGEISNLVFTTMDVVNMKDLQSFTSSLTISVTSCPPTTYLEESSWGYSCETCSSEMYNLDGGNCLSCPENVASKKRENCATFNRTSLELHVKEGFYVHPSFSNPEKLLACVYSKACSSFDCLFTQNSSTPELVCNMDSSDPNCADGYEDRLCSKCVCNDDSCYFPTSDGMCVECHTSHRNRWVGNELIITNIVILMGVLYMLITKAIPSPLIRGLWFFIQTTFTLLVPDSLPSWVYSMESRLPFLSSAPIYGLQCLVPQLSEPIPKFLVEMSSPFLLTLLATLAIIAFRFLRLLEKKLNLFKRFKLDCLCSCMPKKEQKEQQPTLGYIIKRSFLLVLNLLYFSLANCILALLEPCDDYDYMPAYPWISCHSHQYHALLALGIGFGFLYIVGIPLLFAFLLVRYRKQIVGLKSSQEQYEFGESVSDFGLLLQQNQPLLSKPNPKEANLINFLIESYAEETYWFEIVWITRKLLIAMSIALVSSSLVQVSAVTFVLTAGIAVQAWLRPYQKKFGYINTMEIITCTLIVITFNIEYHIKEFGSGTSKVMMQSMLLGLNLLLGVGFLVAMAVQLHQSTKSSSTDN